MLLKGGKVYERARFLRTDVLKDQAAKCVGDTSKKTTSCISQENEMLIS